MVKIDFNQSLHDHRGILILVKPIGYIGQNKFRHIFDEISKCKHAQVPNTTRTLALRYSEHIHLSSIEWGTFQVHRKVLGLICVAKCSEVTELGKLQKQFDEPKSHYRETLLDTRCFVFGCKSSEDAKVNKGFVLISDENATEELHKHFAEFAASLFHILESKRLGKLSEKPDKMINAPLEHEPINNEPDNRNYKRRCLGRMKKHIGDLSLLAGLPQDALCHYAFAIEQLRIISDPLWLAAAIEGLCASSIALSSTHVSRNFKSLILPTTTARATSMVLNGMGNDIDEAKFRNTSPLNEEEIVESLFEVLRLYNRVKPAYGLEVEAHLKYIRYLISQNKKIEANIAIQNATAIIVTLNESEKIQMYSAIAILYNQLGFHRKSAFFSRIAAMQCVSQTLPTQAWPKSYELLRRALAGYRINLDPNEFLRVFPNGWPALQIRLLNELIFTARRLGDPSFSVSHMSFLLHTMHDHLSDAEKNEMAELLEKFASECVGSPKSPSSLENDIIRKHGLLPPVSFTRMPLVRCFKVHTLASHLKPVGKKRLAASHSSGGVFIFSSLRARAEKSKAVRRVLWVEGDHGEVSLEVYNPMPFELKVDKMVLHTEGVDFEAFPTCLSLPPKGGPHTVILLGTPLGAGYLYIKGYTVSVFGTDSTCILKEDNLESKGDLPVTVEVVPSMALMQVSTSLPKVRSQPMDPESPGTAPLVTAITLYAGQSTTGKIKLENIGIKSVEAIEVSVGNDYSGKGAVELFSFDDEEIKSCLPLASNETAEITVTIVGSQRPPLTYGTAERPRRHDPEAPWGLTGVIKFRYSAGPMEDVLARCVSMSIDVTVVPSLHCSNFVMWPIKSEESMCLLMFEAENKTSNDMELTYRLQCSTVQQFVKNHEFNNNDNEVLSIQGNDSRKIAVRLPRFVLPVPDKAASIKTEGRIADYSRALQQMLKLEWKLPACQASGSKTLYNLHLTEEMMEALKPVPLLFDVKLNNQPHEPKSHMTIEVDIALDVSLTVRSCSDIPYGPLRLNVEPYQDNGCRGCRVTELDDQVAWVGNLQLYIPKLLPGEEFQHSCSFVFLYPGQYFISLLCTDCSSGQFERPRTLRVTGVGEVPPKHSHWSYPHLIKIIAICGDPASQ